MARVTVEDCVVKIPNRFELVLIAAQRARDLSAGAQMLVDQDNDKRPVVALREIADTDISLENLRNAVVKGLQKTADVDEPEDDGEINELFAESQGLVRPGEDEVRGDALSAVDDDADDGDGDGDDIEAVPDDVALDDDAF